MAMNEHVMVQLATWIRMHLFDRKILILLFSFVVLLSLGGTLYVYFKLRNLAPIPVDKSISCVSLKKTPSQWRYFAENKKIWVHAAYRDFDADILQQNNGIEIDIFIKINGEDTKLFVNHDLAEGDNLTNLIGKLKGQKSDYYYWLDLKNLVASNAQKTLEKIVDILVYYKIPHEQVIVESSAPECLGIFTEKGFLTSYYLPDITHGEKNLNNKLQNIIKNVESNNICAISSSISGYEIYGKVFPEMIRLHWGVAAFPNMKPYKYWLFRHVYRHKIKEILADPKVRVLLVYPGQPVEKTKEIITGA